MERFKKIGTRLGLVISVVLHGALFFALSRWEPLEARHSISVQLEIIGKKEPPPSLRPQILEESSSPPPAAQEVLALPPAEKRKVRRKNDPSEIASPSDAQREAVRGIDEDLPGSGAVEADPEVSDDRKTDSGTSPTKPPTIRALTFSGFERVMGDNAERERKAYQEERLNARREKGAFVSEDKRVKAALWRHKSFAEPGFELPLGKNRTAASAYILSIHRKLSLRFSDFLRSFDSPFERMHKAVGEGPLVHNPFYAAPPLVDRQDAASGPLSDLSLRTMAEFEIFPTGNLGEVRIVHCSSSDVFDAGAVHSILKSAPFAPPPKELLSRNDRTYIQWTFFRDWEKNTPGTGHVLLLSPRLSPEILPVDAGLSNEE